jgi:hypothetical protein
MAVQTTLGVRWFDVDCVYLLESLFTGRLAELPRTLSTGKRIRIRTFFGIMTLSPVINFGKLVKHYAPVTYPLKRQLSSPGRAHLA